MTFKSKLIKSLLSTPSLPKKNRHSTDTASFDTDNTAPENSVEVQEPKPEIDPEVELAIDFNEIRQARLKAEDLAIREAKNRLEAETRAHVAAEARARAEANARMTAEARIEAEAAATEDARARARAEVIATEKAKQRKTLEAKERQLAEEKVKTEHEKNLLLKAKIQAEEAVVKEARKRAAYEAQALDKVNASM